MSWSVDPKIIQNVFLVVWLSMMLAGLIFWRMASPAAKQKWRTPISVFAGVVFLTFTALIAGRSGFFFALVPVTVIMWMNAKLVRICPRCGTTARNPMLYPPPRFCPGCGASLESSAGE